MLIIEAPFDLAILPEKENANVRHLLKCAINTSRAIALRSLGWWSEFCVNCRRTRFHLSLSTKFQEPSRDDGRFHIRAKVTCHKSVLFTLVGMEEGGPIPAPKKDLICCVCEFGRTAPLRCCWCFCCWDVPWKTLFEIYWMEHLIFFNSYCHFLN